MFNFVSIFSSIKVKLKQAEYFILSTAFQSLLAYKNIAPVLADYFLPIPGYEYILKTKDFGDYHISAKNGDIHIANESFVTNEYSNNNISAKVESQVLLDIGGHIGFFCIPRALKNPKVRIYSYEPEIKNFLKLKKNIDLNKVSENIIPLQIAIGIIEGETIFYGSAKSAGGTINEKSVLIDVRKKKYEEIVKVTTLENEINRLNLKVIDILKIDCEGMEYDILFNLNKKFFSIINEIYVECHPINDNENIRNSRNMINFLSGLGYKVKIEKKVPYYDVVLLHAIK